MTNYEHKNVSWKFCKYPENKMKIYESMFGGETFAMNLKGFFI
jgi:hypothetical protein